MAPKNYNNLLTSGRRSNKDPKDAHILALVVVDQMLADNSRKSSKKYHRESTKVEPDYIRDLSPWMIKYSKGGVVNRYKDGKEYWWCKEQNFGKGKWVHHKTEDHRKWTRNLSKSGGSTKSSR